MRRKDHIDTIEQLWQRIEAAMRAHAPDALARLAPGADVQAIKQLENELEVILPQSFQDSCRVHEGGYTLELVSQMEVLSLEGIAAVWHVLEELLEDVEWASQQPYYFTEEVVRSGWETGPIKPVWWHRSWIPFGEDPTGNLCCLDMDPAPGGTVGQIIDWDHEAGPSRVLHRGFEQLLAAFAERLENGSGDTEE